MLEKARIDAERR
jgi:hypothetical protein